MNKKKVADFGSISSGTMRAKDLIPTFLDTLEGLNKRHAQRLRREYANEIKALEIDPDNVAGIDEQSEQQDYFLNEVLSLSRNAPRWRVVESTGTLHLMRLPHNGRMVRDGNAASRND